MTSALTVAPLPYDPAFEVPEEHEAQTQADLDQTLLKISETTFKDAGHALRSVHAKSHGLLHATLEVPGGLAPELAQGIFARPRSYPVVMRLSSTPGDILDDSVSTPRGMAIKVVGVEGPRLPGAEGAVTQDFVLVNGPVFAAPSGKKFLSSLKLLAATTDKVPNLKKVFSAALRGTEQLIEAAGGESGTLKALGGHPETNVLGETYFSQAPILWGPYMVKVSVAPVSAELKALTDAHVELKDKPHGLRDAVVEHFATHGGQWEIRVQFCTDLKTMPIEDASVPWPEEQSPWMTVGRIIAEPQVAWSEARARVIDGGMAFSPWHGVAAHRPIGSVMRLRKMAYEASSKFRAAHGSMVREPASAADLLD